MKTRKDRLRVRIADGRLVISIGLDTLAHAIEITPDLQSYDEGSGEYTSPKITNIDVFAKGMVIALESEEEDGTTPVHKLLDAAAEEAIEQGAEGIHIDGVDD